MLGNKELNLPSVREDIILDVVAKLAINLPLPTVDVL
jgi:hypothetical protein